MHFLILLKNTFAYNFELIRLISMVKFNKQFISEFISTLWKRCVVVHSSHKMSRHTFDSYWTNEEYIRSPLRILNVLLFKKKKNPIRYCIGYHLLPSFKFRSNGFVGCVVITMSGFENTDNTKKKFLIKLNCPFFFQQTNIIGVFNVSLSAFHSASYCSWQMCYFCHLYTI